MCPVSPFVQQFNSPTAIAEALLTETGLTVPAHRSESGVMRRERRYDIEAVGSRIDEQTRRHIESWAMRDLVECGRLTRNALQRAAAELASELFSEHCKRGAA